MLATIPAIIEVGLALIQGAQALIKLGRDAGPNIVLLKELFGGAKVTVERLAEIRAESDKRNAAIEAQTEAGQ